MIELQTYFAKLNHKYVRWALVGGLALLSLFKIYHVDETQGFDARTYDQLLKHRLWSRPADSNIVILDIDERSLEQMRTEFGRWPWPRETLADALEWLNQQGVQAVVFDILFADADTLNPASDLAFVNAVKQSTNSYFPILRLNPINDALSEVKVDQLKGFAHKLQDGSSSVPKIAVVAPTFEAILQTQRMGYHNIYADEDGVNRAYRLWEDKEGWRLWSLPARIALDLGWRLPAHPSQLIHYTSSKNAYTRISFSDVWKLSQSSKGREQDPRFANAVVIIGSTATSLFDVKVTPIDSTHPGVMVLANVLDDIKHQSFIQLAPKWLQLMVAWLGLVIVVWASTKLREDQMKWAAPVAPALFMGLGFVSLHSGVNAYWDLTQPASNALLFFTLWAIYLNWRTRFLGRFAFNDDPKKQARWRCSAVLQIDFQRITMQEVFNHLSHELNAPSILRLGAVNHPPATGIGLVHVACDEDPLHLEKALFEWRDKGVWAYSRQAERNTLNCDQFWKMIWSDVYQAKHHWRTKHDES